MLSHEGLGGFEEHPRKLLDSAVSTYQKSDASFKVKYATLEAEYMQAIEKILQSAADQDSAMESVGKSILEESANQQPQA